MAHIMPLGGMQHFYLAQKMMILRMMMIINQEDTSCGASAARSKQPMSGQAQIRSQRWLASHRQQFNQEAPSSADMALAATASKSRAMWP
jgi:hypothetical protein